MLDGEIPKGSEAEEFLSPQKCSLRAEGEAMSADSQRGKRRGSLSRGRKEIATLRSQWQVGGERNGRWEESEEAISHKGQSV